MTPKAFGAAWVCLMILVTKADAPRRPHTHVILFFADGNRLAYVDPRRFLVSFFAEPSVLLQELQRLGPDPLHWNATEQTNVIRAESQN